MVAVLGKREVGKKNDERIVVEGRVNWKTMVQTAICPGRGGEGAAASVGGGCGVTQV